MGRIDEDCRAQKHRARNGRAWEDEKDELARGASARAATKENNR